MKQIKPGYYIQRYLRRKVTNETRKYSAYNTKLKPTLKPF